jgi:hypothetical protein
MTMNDANGNLQIVPGRDERGRDVFSVMVKRSYRLSNRQIARRAEIDQVFRAADEHYDGDPDGCTVKHESETAAYKAACDVVIVGKAHAPNGVPAQQMTVSVAVAGREKSLLITGNRQSYHREGQAPVFSDPRPFLTMEIRYDFAYGGRDEISLADVPFHYPRNPMGKGVALHNLRAVIEGMPLPNVEDPNDVLTPDRVVIDDPARWHLQPIPHGLGWRQRNWYPRDALLGSYPAFLPVGTVTAEEQMGLLQRNQIALAKQCRLAPFEAGFNNGASIGLIFGALRGDERITLRGLTPDSLLEFQLPGETPKMALDLGEGLIPLQTRLQTISIRPDESAMDIIWCGAQTYPGPRWLAKLKRLHAQVQ